MRFRDLITEDSSIKEIVIDGVVLYGRSSLSLTKLQTHPCNKFFARFMNLRRAKKLIPEKSQEAKKRALALAKRFNIKVTTDPITDYQWTGKELRTGSNSTSSWNESSPSSIFHDIAHWQLAYGVRRFTPEFGLGSGAFTKDYQGSIKNKAVSKRYAQAEETKTCSLEYCWLLNFGIDFESIFELNSYGYCVDSGSIRLSAWDMTLRDFDWLVSAGFIDESGKPVMLARIGESIVENIDPTYGYGGWISPDNKVYHVLFQEHIWWLAGHLGKQPEDFGYDKAYDLGWVRFVNEKRFDRACLSIQGRYLGVKRTFNVWYRALGKYDNLIIDLENAVNYTTDSEEYTIATEREKIRQKYGPQNIGEARISMRSGLQGWIDPGHRVYYVEYQQHIQWIEGHGYSYEGALESGWVRFAIDTQANRGFGTEMNLEGTTAALRHSFGVWSHLLPKLTALYIDIVEIGTEMESKEFTLPQDRDAVIDEFGSVAEAVVSFSRAPDAGTIFEYKGKRYIVDSWLKGGPGNIVMFTTRDKADHVHGHPMDRGNHSCTAKVQAIRIIGKLKNPLQIEHFRAEAARMAKIYGEKTIRAPLDGVNE